MSSPVYSASIRGPGNGWNHWCIGCSTDIDQECIVVEVNFNDKKLVNVFVCSGCSIDFDMAILIVKNKKV